METIKTYPDQVTKVKGSLTEILSRYAITKTALKNWTIQEKESYVDFIPKKIDPPLFQEQEAKIVYEDEACLVAYKPFGQLVHSDGSGENTLEDDVNSYLALQNFPYKAKACHRIDTSTCGLVLFNKIPFLQNFFDKQFRDQTIEKEYYVLVDGLFPWPKKRVKKPIGKDRHDAKKMIPYSQGKEAETLFEKIKEANGRTLLKAKIFHGRKHQIRVHAAYLGFPIVNDRLYNPNHKAGVLGLESMHLVFDSPIQTKKVDIEVDLDPRLADFI
ncbi:RluA family pseudouridine synthase [Dubosiella newyorkensis]|jgi:23S rRNA pseudouridine1911/1915/1917 synthase|uniref:RluA family pseudouridine synthase n=1 Tax=Dubosiella newyorkensis TaxID=1862672 RepID=UPI0023537E1C|nr:RluA family pseudouridine synthase [Dubosiella newyorkensis]MCI9041050.1 RluA family pseudouridine synthase [Dubosiella newyorkensis]